jgi:Putative zinc-finger
MNTSTSPTIKRPCAAWANSLAAGPDDLTDVERAALDAHLATCEACSSARVDYARMDALIRSLPAPAPLISLPAYPSDRRPADDTQDTVTRESVAPPTNFISGMATRRRSQLSPQWAAFRAIAAVLIVGVVVAGFAALLGHRQSRPGVTTGPQPQVGDWRLLSTPSEAPNQASGGQFILTPQTSVAGLLYACWSEPAPDGSALLWRSEDSGLHWKRLATPTTAPTRCYLEVSPGAPNTVFLDTTSSTPGYYSLDRGDHWSRHTPPAGYEQWNAGAPTAEGDVWYYLSRDADEQPVFLVTSDRGAHWETHGFPFHLNISPLPGPSPLFGPYLRVRYEKGGYIVPYEDTLWWTPDYGATWRKLGAWGDGSMGYTPPCGGLIRGTPDLSLFYCVAWNGQFEYRPYWRSVDRGLTWRAVPYGPPVTPTKDTPLAGIGAIPMLLRDGSLLQLSPTPGDPSKVAFYSLAPGTNVWRQASKPLNDVVRLCSSQQGAGPAPTCVIPPTIVITDGANGGQNIYLTQADGTTVMAAIAWR